MKKLNSAKFFLKKIQTYSIVGALVDWHFQQQITIKRSKILKNNCFLFRKSSKNASCKFGNNRNVTNSHAYYYSLFWFIFNSENNVWKETTKFSIMIIQNTTSWVDDKINLIIWKNQLISKSYLNDNKM